MEDVKWRFNPGDRTGINDSGIETFRGQMVTSLGREICQNSIDALLESKDKVVVEFKEFDLPREKLPGIEELEANFKKGLQFWSQENNKVDQAINFFEKGLHLLKKDYLKVLRVSDFNTTGLLKSKESFSSPWINLIMASGVSQKSGTAGGSFGIGKSAPFACTDLRTVFYSTFDAEGVEASQGVSRIATFIDDEKETSGKGYYGGYDPTYPNGCVPIYKQLFLDPKFTREDSGSDIYLIGFREFENWEEELIVSLLEDFLISIYEDKLEVIIENTILNSQTLDDIINSYYKKYKKRLNKTYNYYKVITSPNTNICEYFLEDLGNIEFKFLLGPDALEENLDFHRQALIIRKSGMKLFDRGHISANIPFAGILTLKDESVNRFFRLLEPPRHDAWEVDLYEGDKTKKYVKAKIQEVYRFMKDKILEYGSIPVADEMDLVGLGDYLPDDFFDTSRALNKKESITDKTKTVDIIEYKTKKKNKEATNIDNDKTTVKGIFGDGGLIGGSKGNTENKRKTKSDLKGKMKGSENGVDISALKRVLSIKERIIAIDKNNARYKFLIDLKESIEIGALEVFIKTEDGQEKADIARAICLNNFNFRIVENKLYFELEEETTNIEVELELKYKGACSMGVKIYGGRL